MVSFTPNNTQIVTNAGKIIGEQAGKIKSAVTKVTQNHIPTPYAEEYERWGYDGANMPGTLDVLRAHMYPQIFDNYNVDNVVVKSIKGKINKTFEALKNLNEEYSTGSKVIRLAPVNENSIRGRNIVTMPLEAFEEVKAKGIQRIIDLREEASVNPTRFSIKDGNTYIDGLEYIQIPMCYNGGRIDLTTISKLPKFFEAMEKGNAYIGCNLGSHRTDFALGLNYALNKAVKDAPPMLYLEPRQVSEGINRIYKKIAKMTPEDRKMYGLTDEFMANFPKDKKELNERLLSIATATKEAK